MLTLAERRERLKAIYNGFTLPEYEGASDLLVFRDGPKYARYDKKPGLSLFGATTRAGRGLSTDDVRAIVDDFEAAPRGQKPDSIKHGCVYAIARKWHISEKRARHFWYAHLEALRPTPAVQYAATWTWPDFDCLPIGQVSA